MSLQVVLLEHLKHNVMYRKNLQFSQWECCGNTVGVGNPLGVLLGELVNVWNIWSCGLALKPFLRSKPDPGCSWQSCQVTKERGCLGDVVSHLTTGTPLTPAMGCLNGFKATWCQLPWWAWAWEVWGWCLPIRRTKKMMTWMNQTLVQSPARLLAALHWSYNTLYSGNVWVCLWQFAS